MRIVHSSRITGVEIVDRPLRGPVVLAPPTATKDEIADQARALLPGDQWAELVRLLYGGRTPKVLLGMTIAGAVAAVVLAAVLVSVMTVLRRPPPPPAAAVPPVAIAHLPSSTVPPTTRPPSSGVKAATWPTQAQAKTVPTGPSSTGTPMPSTTLPTGKVGPAVRDAVHQAQQTIKTAPTTTTTTGLPCKLLGVLCPPDDSDP